MLNEKIFLGQNPKEVLVAMKEEDAYQCYGCPNATLTAAEIVHRTNLLCTLVYQTELTEGTFISNTENFIEEKRDELRAYTLDCNGYSALQRDGGRPAGMCDSPKVEYSRLEIVARKLWSILGL